jgi:hypothetical protein
VNVEWNGTPELVGVDCCLHNAFHGRGYSTAVRMLARVRAVVMMNVNVHVQVKLQSSVR